VTRKVKLAAIILPPTPLSKRGHEGSLTGLSPRWTKELVGQSNLAVGTGEVVLQRPKRKLQAA